MFCSFQSKYCTYLLNLYHFIHFDTVINGIVSILSFFDGPLQGYRNYTGFSTLTLYPTTLLSSFIGFHIFNGFLWISYIQMMSSAMGESLTSSSPFSVPLASFFFFFANPVNQTRGEHGHPCLTPEPKRKTFGLSH